MSIQQSLVSGSQLQSVKFTPGGGVSTMSGVGAAGRGRQTALVTSSAAATQPSTAYDNTFRRFTSDWSETHHGERLGSD